MQVFGTEESPSAGGGRGWWSHTLCVAVARENVCAQQQISRSMCRLLLDADAYGMRKEEELRLLKGGDKGRGPEILRTGILETKHL